MFLISHFLFVAGLLWVPTARADWEDCTWKVDGKTYSVAAMAGMSVNGTDTKVATYKYQIALCGNITSQCEDIMTGVGDYGAIYQFGGEPGGKTVCWDILSYWEKTNGASGGIVASKLQSGGEGFSLEINNGDSCKSKPRKTTVNVICEKKYDPTAKDQAKRGVLTGQQDTDDSCHFIL